MPGKLIELQRCRDAEGVLELTRLLDEAGIPHRVGSDAPVTDISSIGTGNEAQAIVSVREEDHEAARNLMEHDSLQVELPSDHYLLTSTDDEIAEIVAQPGEWSAFDVAHARRLMKERGIDPHRIEIKRQERLQQLREGKQASPLLIGFGWLATIAGGWFGIIIAWSLCHSKEKTPDGDFHTYNVRSRAMGKEMFPFACVTGAVGTFVWLYMMFHAVSS